MYVNWMKPSATTILEHPHFGGVELHLCIDAVGIIELPVDCQAPSLRSNNHSRVTHVLLGCAKMFQEDVSGSYPVRPLSHHGAQDVVGVSGLAHVCCALIERLRPKFLIRQSMGADNG
jgi:hypothetical protein